MTSILSGVVASGKTGHLSSPIAGSFDALATISPSGVSTVTFNGIPNTYTHLQLRVSMLGAAGGSLLTIRFNGDTGNNYTWHALTSQGTGAGSFGATAQSYANVFGRDVGTSATYPTAVISDILEYSNSTKNKVIRTISGMDANGSGEIHFVSNTWLNTTPINSLTFRTHDGTNFASGTSIALYGVK